MSNREAAETAGPGSTGATRTDESSTTEGGDAPATEDDAPVTGDDPPATGDDPSATGDDTASAAASEVAGDPGDLVVVCGLPGVGKTTVAERIAGHLDARVLRTDVIRKQLFPDPEYTDEEAARVYAELLARARDRVRDGESVVLDATFANGEFRDDVRAVADRAADRFELVKVECDEDVVRRRIRARDGISDADFDVHLRDRRRPRRGRQLRRRVRHLRPGRRRGRRPRRRGLRRAPRSAWRGTTPLRSLITVNVLLSL